VDFSVVCLYTTGMMTVQAARGILADAEKALRELMQQQIQEQRYGDLAEIAALADGIARLLRGQPSGKPLPKHTSRSASTRPSPRKRVSSVATKRSYPVFERDGDRLVKVGWSKKARDEYEHRAPRDAVQAFVRHLVSRVEPGSTFVMEDLLPVPDSSGGEVPSYQVYMTLAWLRDQGAVEKKGRDGYVLQSGRQMDDGVFNKIWERTPQRS